MSQIFTIQDEAFVLLVFMNNWKVWEEIANGDKRKRGKNSNTLFTNTKKKYNGKDIKIKGWNNEAMKEFNETGTYLSTVRNMDDVIEIENDLKEEYKRMNSTKCGKQKRDNNDESILAERVLPFDGYSQTFVQR